VGYSGKSTYPANNQQRFDHSGSLHANVVPLTFAPQGNFLVAYSDKGTIPFFGFEPNDHQKRAIATWRSSGYQPAIVEFMKDDENQLISTN
jgi:hypothetical protein